MNMASLSFSLPVELQRYVESRVAAGGFDDPAEFLLDLIERDRAAYQSDVQRVRALIQEGIDSGVVDAEAEDVLDEVIADIHARHG